LPITGEGGSCENTRKLICGKFFFPSKKILQGSLGPTLSKEVRGVVENCLKSFLITQTCGGGDFFMILKDFHENSFKIIKNWIQANVKV